MSRKKLRFQDIFTVFNWKDERARGRSACLLSTIFSTFASQLAMAGTIYTAFLTVNDFSIVDAGIITFLPSAAAVFVLVSPVLLERFPKRKVLLTVGRSLYYGINIIGITLIALFVHEQRAKLVCFGIVIFFSHSFNALTSGGYSVWQLNFLPDEIRPRYFSYSQIISSIFSGIVLLSSGLIADTIRGTEQEFSVLILMRVIGLLFAVLDIVILAIPKEYPYPSTGEKIRIRNTFVFPFRHKKFMLTMMVLAFWNVTSGLTSSWTYYLMNTVEIKVTLLNALDFIYIFFLLFVSPFWRKVLQKYSWFTMTAICIIPTSMITLLLAGVNKVPNPTLYFLIIQLILQTVRVGLNLGFANFTFINMPSENQTYFMSYYLLQLNMVVLGGQAFGTWLLYILGDSVSLFGFSLDTPAMMVVLQSVLQLFVGVLILDRKSTRLNSSHRT